MYTRPTRPTPPPQARSAAERSPAGWGTDGTRSRSAADRGGHDGVRSWALVNRRSHERRIESLETLANPLSPPRFPGNPGPVVQLVTSIKNTTSPYTYGADLHGQPLQAAVGHESEGLLDPSDPKKGSAPGENQIKPVMTAFTTQGYQSMIKGHLMNGQLGGPGMASNLFPITSKANSWHKNYAENHIKDAVTKGSFVHYHVKVVRPPASQSFNIDEPEATFNCVAHHWDAAQKQNGKELFKLGVRSVPAAKGKGSAKLIDLDNNAEATLLKKSKLAFFDWMPTSLSFATSKLAKGWGEEGDGNAAPGGRGDGRITAQQHYEQDGHLL